MVLIRLAAYLMIFNDIHFWIPMMTRCCIYLGAENCIIIPTLNRRNKLYIKSSISSHPIQLILYLLTSCSRVVRGTCARSYYVYVTTARDRLYSLLKRTPNITLILVITVFGVYTQLPVYPINSMINIFFSRDAFDPHIFNSINSISMRERIGE